MRFLLTGASGQLGAYLIDQLLALGHRPIAWSFSTTGSRSGITFESVDLSNQEGILRGLNRTRPDTIIHAAALSAAEAVRLDPSLARVLNVQATEQVAGWALENGRRLVFTSTDLVFDGSRAWNREDDPASPIMAYGRTKLAPERSVLSVPGGVVTRLSLLYGFNRCGRPYFYDRAIDGFKRGQTQTFFEDEYRTPLHLATAAEIVIRLAESNETGLFHVGGDERVSRFDLMRRSAIALGLDPSLIRPNRRSDVSMPEPRPADVSLDTHRLMAVFPIRNGQRSKRRSARVELVSEILRDSPVQASSRRSPGPRPDWSVDRCSCPAAMHLR